MYVVIKVSCSWTGSANLYQNSLRLTYCATAADRQMCRPQLSSPTPRGLPTLSFSSSPLTSSGCFGAPDWREPLPLRAHSPPRVWPAWRPATATGSGSIGPTGPATNWHYDRPAARRSLPTTCHAAAAAMQIRRAEPLPPPPAFRTCCALESAICFSPATLICCARVSGNDYAQQPDWPFGWKPSSWSP